jgi:cyclic pyranopterin phosphate synthase
VSRLTHIDDDGRASMVDVGAKAETERTAVAESVLMMHRDTVRAVVEGSGPKGEVIQVARLAGIQAAKRTADLIPLAHPLALTYVDVQVQPEAATDAASLESRESPEAGGTGDADEGQIKVVATVRTVGKTGVEMEALTACSVAALAIYDMVKGVERGVRIESTRLLEKRGGKSGIWRADGPPDRPVD